MFLAFCILAYVSVVASRRTKDKFTYAYRDHLCPFPASLHPVTSISDHMYRLLLLVLAALVCLVDWLVRARDPKLHRRWIPFLILDYHRLLQWDRQDMHAPSAFFALARSSIWLSVRTSFTCPSFFRQRHILVTPMPLHTFRAQQSSATASAGISTTSATAAQVHAPTLRQQKRELRKEMARKLRELGPEETAAQSEAVAELVLASAAWKAAHTVSVYVSMDSAEVHTDALCSAALGQGAHNTISWSSLLLTARARRPRGYAGMRARTRRKRMRWGMWC